MRAKAPQQPSSLFLSKMAVVADSKDPVTPCGACRQVLAEFSTTLPVCSANLEGAIYESSIAELLPRAKEGILGT